MNYSNMTFNELIREAEHDNNRLALALVDSAEDKRNDLLRAVVELLDDIYSNVDFQMTELKNIFTDDEFMHADLMRYSFENKLGDSGVTILELDDMTLSADTKEKVCRAYEDSVNAFRRDAIRLLKREWLKELASAATIHRAECALTNEGVSLDEIEWSFLGHRAHSKLSDEAILSEGDA